MQKIQNFLTTTNNYQGDKINRTAEMLSKYDDIKSEFECWIDTQEYPINGISIEGYNAANISKLAPFMSGVGVYCFLVTLRENPKFGKQIIQEGFKRK